MKTSRPDANFAKLLQEFFLERLINQRNASPQTVAAYRDSFRLLLQFAHSHFGKAPEHLALTDLDASVVLAFLNHLENERHNTIRSRNARFAAIRSFLHFAALKEPTALPVIQRVLAIPMKRFDKPLLGFLSHAEIKPSSMRRTAARGADSAIGSCSRPCTTPVPGYLKSRPCARPTSCGRAARRCASMARGARIAAYQSGGRRPLRFDTGCHGSTAGPIGRSSRVSQALA
jgi:hypothetical protein